MSKPRFKDHMLERNYQLALESHDILYRQPGNAGAGHRAAYSAGYRGDRRKYARNTIAYAFYVAGKENAHRDENAETAG